MKGTKLEYRIATGYHVKKAHVESLFIVLRDKFKGQRPSVDALIKEAKRKTSPIHGMFDWNQKRAAEEHWRERAGYYLRAVVLVRVSVKTGKAVSGPVRFSVPVKYRGHAVERYVAADKVGESSADVYAVLERVRNEFHGWLNRYQAYTGFLEMFDPVVTAFEEIEKKLDAQSPKPKRRKAG